MSTELGPHQVEEIDMRKIKILDSSFIVRDSEMSKNYSDISEMFHFLSNLSVGKTPVFLDIGANIGIFSLAYATLYLNSQVYSFEPIKQIYNELEGNIKLNPNLQNRIHLINQGISDSSADRFLSIPTAEQHERYLDNINCGLYSVYGLGRTAVAASFTTLDAFTTKTSLKKIDVIKIDCEGSEFEVLQGGQETIRKYRPTIIMEFNELTRTLSSYDSMDFEKFFLGLGYSLFGLEYGWKEDLKPLSSLRNVKGISDIIAVCPARKNN